MTPSRRPIFALLVLAGLAWCAGGCLKMQMHWQVYPDGSGKVKMRAIVRPPMIPGMDASRQDPKEMEKRLRAASPFKDFAGLVIKPGSARSDVHEGTLRFYAEGYFTDINQVTRKGEPVLRFTPLEGGGYEAHYLEDEMKSRIAPPRGDKPLPGSEGADDGSGTKAGTADPAKDPGKQMEAMMKSMMKGLEVKLFLKMPADLTKTNVAKRNARTALLEITDKMLDDPAEQARISKLDGVRARCGVPSPEQQAEFEAFRKELASVLAEAEAAAGKEGGNGSGGDFPDEDK